MADQVCVGICLEVDFVAGSGSAGGKDDIGALFIDQGKESDRIIYEVGFKKKKIAGHVFRAAEEGAHAAGICVLVVPHAGDNVQLVGEFIIPFAAVPGTDDNFLNTGRNQFTYGGTDNCFPAEFYKALGHRIGPSLEAGTESACHDNCLSNHEVFLLLLSCELHECVFVFLRAFFGTPQILACALEHPYFHQTGTGRVFFKLHPQCFGRRNRYR